MATVTVAQPRAGADPVLWASCLAMLAIGINGTAIMAALPTMRAQLPLSASGVQWAVNAYLIVSASCIVLGGAAAGRFGACAAAIAGLALFAIGSCLIALAGSQVILLAGRALQGLAAAFAVPATLAAVGGGAAERRAAAIGAWTGFLMLGFSIGPLVGGVLTHVASWRVIFWINVPLMLAAAAGLAGAGGTDAPAERAMRGRADLTGFVLVAIFMVALVFGLQGLQHAGSAPVAAIAPLALAAAALAAMLVVGSRAASPLVDLRFFVRRGFVLGVAIGSLAMGCILSLLLFYNLYAQSPAGLGLTPLAAGASLLPLSATLLVVALSASAVTARFGLRAAMAGGMALVAAACVILALAAVGGGIFVLAIGFIVMGAGLALPYAGAPRLALGALPQAQTGQGSGIINACTFLGGSIGVAVGAIAFNLGGFVAVLTMIAVAGLIGVGLSRMIARAG